MNKFKRGLGKGLAALIPETSILTGGRTIVNINIDKIVPNPRQPRAEISSESLDELAASIRAQGIAQPILVRGRGDRYELVAGERRWRAARKAGLSLIPAIIKDFSDEESLEIALVENLQREDLNPMDEAEAYRRLSKEFGLTQSEISKRVGKDRSTVANAMRLLDLPKEIQTSIRKGEINPGHARPLLSLSSSSEQVRVWRGILKNELNVRDIENLIYETSSHSSKPRKKSALNSELAELAEILIQHLGTKVRVRGSTKKGKIEIEYFSQEDLERLIDLITAGGI